MAAPASAQPTLYDWCTGVDHPPFEQAYPGDGASYFRIGASREELGNLVAVFDRATMDLIFDAPGVRTAAFPIYSYGDYP